MSDNNAPVKFRSLTREVVDSFLQTVVVLDDRAEMSQAPEEKVSLDELESPEYRQLTGQTDRGDSHDPQGAPLHAKSVIDGFAEIGSVCAVLKIAPDDEGQERIIKTVRRADIVILDWVLHESIGEAALGLLRKIVERDGCMGRLRLISIYTVEPDLRKIYEQVSDVVDEFYQDEELRETEGFRISKGPLNVVILAKESEFTRRVPGIENQIVAESNLANRLANEFADMTGGLIRNAAIAGIAGIRNNAHRLLAKFEPSLDPAYLGHRLLLPNPPDAEIHIEEVLAAEIASVLEEHRPGARANKQVIASWLAHRKSKNLNLSKPFAIPAGYDEVEYWSTLLEEGLKVTCLPKPKPASKKEKGVRKRSAEPFAEDAESVLQSNNRFAALLMLKTSYHSQPPRLSIGTILCTGESEQRHYFLCLQPKCDSVRLECETGFPFIPLVPMDYPGSGDKKSTVRLVLEHNDDEWQYFGIESTPSKLMMVHFRPIANPPGEVIASKGDGFWLFEETGGTQYRWIAQLKDEHALSVAGDVAANLARPGPNDAEWLRRAEGSFTVPNVPSS